MRTQCHFSSNDHGGIDAWNVGSADGRVMDGMHRIAKALLQGSDSIQAVRFPVIQRRTTPTVSLRAPVRLIVVRRAVPGQR